MIYKSEILTGIDANIARIQDRLNAELPWSANCDIFGRIAINKKNDSNVLEWYASNGEYREIFINDQKSIIGFLVDETRTIVTNKVDVSILFSIYIPLTYLDTINHDEHVIMDAQRVLRNSGLININEINTDFEALYKGVNIKRIQHRNLYPFVNFVITGTMRYVDKCLNYVIARNLTYSSFSAVYAVDTNYNDIITCSLTVTNNTSVAQNTTIYFRLDDYFVQITHVIAENSSYVFTYDFEDVDIYIENIVTAHDSAMVQVGSVTLAATAKPVFEMFFTSGTLAFRVGRYVESFITYLELEDGSTREVNINNYADTTYIAISQVYALATSKRIRILDTFSVDYLYANAQTNLTIDYNQLEKLRNLTCLVLYNLPNCYIAEHEIEKLTSLTYLYLYNLPNCYVSEHEIEKLTNLTYLQINSLPNCYIAEHEIEKLRNLTYLLLYNLPNYYVSEHELEKLTSLTYLYLYNLPNCYVSEHEIEKLTNLTYLYLHSLSNCYIAEHEIEKLTNLTNLILQLLSNCYIAEHEIEKLTKLTYLILQLLSNCYIAEHEIEKLTSLTYLQINSLPNCYIAEHEIEKLTKISKTNQIFIQSISRLKVANNEQFPTHYLLLNNNNMTSTDCDNVFISCHSQLLAGFVPGTKNINTAGVSNGKVTAASLTARNYLVGHGYTLTYNS